MATNATTETESETNNYAGRIETALERERPLALTCPACGTILPTDTSETRIETCPRCRRAVRPREVLRA